MIKPIEKLMETIAELPTRDDYYSIQEVALKLKISRQAVLKRIYAGTLVGYRIGKSIIILPKGQF